MKNRRHENTSWPKMKKGDTLIEVVLAVGIFSMVAVAVMAVMNGGAASAQMALEATLAREEVDAQAEALRFIQASYIADRDNNDNKYSKLWNDIKDKAIDGKDVDMQFPPDRCSELYKDGGEVKAKKGFVLNTRNLGADDLSEGVLVSGDSLKMATTYPRLVYSDDSSLTNDSSTTLSAVEGIYIVAVKDPDTTTIGNNKASAYYDFYIRTCWYGSGGSAPSTIYTVVRLGDPYNSD